MQSVLGTIAGDFFGSGLAIDASGNIFVMAIDDISPVGASTIYEFTPDGVQSTFGTVRVKVLALPSTLRAIFSQQTLWMQLSTSSPPMAHRASSLVHQGFLPTKALSAWLLIASAICSSQQAIAVLKFTPDGEGTPFATDLDNARGLALIAAVISLSRR